MGTFLRNCPEQQPFHGITRGATPNNLECLSQHMRENRCVTNPEDGEVGRRPVSHDLWDFESGSVVRSTTTQVPARAPDDRRSCASTQRVTSRSLKSWTCSVAYEEVTAKGQARPDFDWLKTQASKGTPHTNETHPTAKPTKTQLARSDENTAPQLCPTRHRRGNAASRGRASDHGNTGFGQQ